MHVNIYKDINTYIFTQIRIPGPCSAILLTASEDDFCTSTSDERRRWISGSSIDSVIGSVTVCVSVCVCLNPVVRSF